jgi:ADP-ribose pyrophosphatase YjhB (NUDIX family)
MKPPREVRGKVVCVFRRGDHVLAFRAQDPSSGETFWRPYGGGIEFGERAVDALAREIREELGQEIAHPRLLGVLENLFTYDDGPGHEIVIVYDAAFADASLYEHPTIDGIEANGESLPGTWVSLIDLGPGSPPLYPDGLLALLRGLT